MGFHNATENFGLNNVDNIVAVLGDANNLKEYDLFDIILANINKNILLNDIKYYTESLKKGGKNIFSGFYEYDLEDIKHECSKMVLYLLNILPKMNGLLLSLSNNRNSKNCLLGMLRNPRILLFIYLIFSFPLAAFSQESDSLSSNSEEFFAQVSEILMNTPSKTIAEKSEILINRFHPVWSAGRFNKEEKNSIREVIEKMRSKKMRAYPQLYDYVYSLMLLGESKQLPKSIISWHAYCFSLLDNTKTKPFNNFMDYTITLLEDDILFKKKSMSWYHRNGKFSFFLDTNFLIKFSKLTLVGATSKDSSLINNTSGVLNYNTLEWNGISGQIEWARFGEDFTDKLFVDFNNYLINLKQSEFTIDSAVLTDKRFFKHSMQGEFSERVLSNNANKRTSYPRFKTYLDDYEVDNIYPNINFKGGFEHKGLKLYGIESKNEKALLELIFNDTIVGKIYSNAFRFDENKLESAKAEIYFYFENDSLFHPNLRIKYNNDDKQLVLYNENVGSNMIPFFDSYHQLDIMCRLFIGK